MKTSDLKDSITGVVVIETELPRLSVFEALGNALASAATDSDIIIVANDVSAKGAQELRLIAEIVPDVTVSFLARRTDREAATVVGIDQALGDWVVVLTPTIEEVASLSRVLEKAGPFEVVFAGGPEPQVPDGRQRTRWYHRLYGFATGVSADAPRIRVYSRAAARYLSRQLDAESMLASIAFSGTFPGIRAVVAELPPLRGERLTISTALRKTLRAVRSVSAIPLRVTIAIALATGFFALLNSMYAVLVYLLKPDVAPGWTTLSLQMSMMMFLFSMMFALLTEYVLGVYRSTPPRRRISVVREFRSPRRRQRNRLNVIAADGDFKFGAPGSLEDVRPSKVRSAM